MIDPMAGLDAGAQAPDATDEKDVIDVMALRFNLQRIDRIRSVMGIVSGCVAGILGLTGLEGFACFLVLHLFVLATIWAFKMNMSLYAHTRQSLFAYATTNFQQSALSFTLFWTLFYGLVYLY